MERREKLEEGFESVLFASRWLMAPFYLGLVVALVALLVEFIKTIVEVLPGITELSEASAVVWILTLIDLSLAANLLLMVIFSGYENFVSKIDTHAHEDRPEWMGTVDFSGLKLKLIASIVAISGIALLKAFLKLQDDETFDVVARDKLMWQVIVHLTFVVSGVLLALMDWLTGHQKGGH